MYARQHLERIQELLVDLLNSASNEGCGEDLTVINESPMNALRDEVDRLLEHEPQAMVGLHDHRHGTSAYVFLVEPGMTFCNGDFAEWLDESYEADRGESAMLVSGEKPTIVANKVQSGNAAQSSAT